MVVGVVVLLHDCCSLSICSSVLIIKYLARWSMVADRDTFRYRTTYWDPCAEQIRSSRMTAEDNRPCCRATAVKSAP